MPAELTKSESEIQITKPLESILEGEVAVLVSSERDRNAWYFIGNGDGSPVRILRKGESFTVTITV